MVEYATRCGKEQLPLRAARGADRIIVMERGQIVEDGNHASLLALDGYYARLCHHQFAGTQVRQKL